MRVAELTMAIVMGVFSVYLMIKSAELPIGWIPDEGPGGGAFPFWLSAFMLICCIWICVNWVRKTSPPSKSKEPYMDRQAALLFAISAGSLIVMVGSIYLIGVYGAIPLFIIFYMRVIGSHTWVMTGILAVSTPIVTFLFFEIALSITLPKGKTEPLFYPLYNFFF